MNIQLAAKEFYDYSNYFRGYSKDTIRRYTHAINYYVKFAQIENLQQATDISIKQMFLDGRMQRAWKPATFHSYQKSLAVFFSWCKERGYMISNPTDGLQSPKLARRLPRNLSQQDAMKLLEAVYNYPYTNIFIQSRNQAIISMLIFAGLRKRELMNLKYSDVDFNQMTIFVSLGKGAKDRLIPISHALAKSLDHYITERKRNGITCAQFFASSQRNRGISEMTIRRLVEIMRTTTKISFTLHQLRHTFATLMIEGGCDIYSLSRMMGHEDIRTTTIYLSATANHLQSQMMKHPLN